MHVISWQCMPFLFGWHHSVNEHLRPMKRRKRPENMQAVCSSSVRIRQKFVWYGMYACMCVCARFMRCAYIAECK